MGTIYLDNTSTQDNSGTSDVADGSVLSGTGATSSGTTVTLDGSPDLSGLNTSGANQSAIYLASGTAANRKIYWITAFDNTAKTVTVDVAPAIAATSNWVIGGRIRPSFITTASQNWRAGDVVLVKNDQDLGTGAFSFRYPGGGPGGYMQIKSADGTRHLITTAQNAAKLVNWNANGNAYFETLQLQNTGTNGIFDSGGSLVTTTCYDCVIPDSGAVSRPSAGFAATYLIRTAWANAGVHSGTDASIVSVECHYHDISGTAFVPSGTFIGNIIDRCTTSAFRPTSNSVSPLLYHNTIYRCDNSGYEETSSTQLGHLLLLGNIFLDNGDAAGEYNVELASITNRVVVSLDNCFSIVGARGGGNVSVFSLGATDITGDPDFVDPDAAAGSRNFGLNSASPAKGIAYTYEASVSISYMDMGAVQRQEPAAGGGLLVNPGMRGGMI